MQSRDGVFKVPKVQKKRVVNLFCNETLEDLDKTWNSPSTMQPVSLSGKKKVSAKTSFTKSYTKDSCLSSRQDIDMNIQHVPNIESSLQVGDPMLATKTISSTINQNNGINDIGIDTFLTHDYDEDLLLQMHRDPSVNNKDFSTEFIVTTDSTVPEIGDMDWVVPEYSVEFSGLENSFDQKASHVGLPKNQDLSGPMSPDRNSTYSPDILLVRDESMRNIDSDSSGSDTDWDSITPPVPGSPSDHRVPDLGGRYSPNFTMVNQQRHQTLRHNTNDHEVPEFML